MPTNHMKKHIDLLKLLKKLKSDELKTISRYLDDRAVDVLCELCFNVVNTQLNLSKRKKKSLLSAIDKSTLLKLSNRAKSVKKRKELLSQSGGFISVLLGALVPVLVDLVYNAV